MRVMLRDVGFVLGDVGFVLRDVGFVLGDLGVMLRSEWVVEFMVRSERGTVVWSKYLVVLVIRRTPDVVQGSVGINNVA